MATKVLGNLGGAGRMAGALDPGSCCLLLLDKARIVTSSSLIIFLNLS
jgi:hypothetical protein